MRSLQLIEDLIGQIESVLGVLPLHGTLLVMMCILQWMEKEVTNIHIVCMERLQIRVAMSSSVNNKSDMKRLLHILLLPLSLGVVLTSCGPTKDERDLVKSFIKGNHPSDEIGIACHLSRKDKYLSVGTLELEYDGETATLPVKVIKDDSGSRHWEYTISQEEVSFTFSSFLVRANHVNNWGEMSKYLSGDTLSEYERYDKEMTRYLENNIFRTHTTSYMEHNNR